MKQFWLNKDECTACAACANICPQNVIQMNNDRYGFSYPVISDGCINCNACQNVCDKRSLYADLNEKTPKTYAAWSQDEKTRFTSTSGGIFSELSHVILEKGGCIAGAQYNRDNMVEHVLIKDEEGLNRIRQSKYVQSDIGFVFREIKKVLEEGKLVAFCGAPCQVAGLYAYLGKKHDNLITFDFICRGMNSPKAYRAWLDELEKMQGSRVSRVWFKYKSGGWKKSPRCTRVDFINGNHIILDGNENLYMMGYLQGNLYMRPSCGNCQFKGAPRQGDITLADFWGLDEMIDDDKGASMVLVNNEKGAQLLDEVRERLTLYERSFDEIFAGNVCFDKSVEISPYSMKFLAGLDAIGFSKAMKRYGRMPIVTRAIKKIIRMRNRLF